MFSVSIAQRLGDRSEQQDRCAAENITNGCIFILSDGMGGHDNGAAAAQTVVDIFLSSLGSQMFASHAPTEAMHRLCREAHRRVNANNAVSGSDSRTTLVALHVGGGVATWCHLGDSRLYLFRGSTLLRRTRDHSLTQLLADLGEISPEDAASHPDRSRLLRCIGGDKDYEPAIDQLEVEPGDAFVLCSDGFWDHVAPHEMAEMVTSPALDDAAQALADQAVLRGQGHADNVTVLAVRIGAASGGEQP